MDYQKFLDFIKAESKNIRENHNLTDREAILAYTVKASEEFGELSEQILGHIGYQRPSKMHKFTPEALGKEFADNLIVLHILANQLKVDLNTALEQKIKTLEERRGTDTHYK